MVISFACVKNALQTTGLRSARLDEARNEATRNLRNQM
jgi:hypothetical protein